MSKLLIKLFVKDYKNTSDPIVRAKYGKLASTFGIVSNIFICIFKLIVGFIFGLISMIADGLNNLTDASSSIISLIGFKLSSKPADKEHPYGHARIEYITGFIISIIIVVLGIQLLIQSVQDIISNWGLTYKKLDTTYFIIIVVTLIISILVKIYQGLFYHKIGKTINSTSLSANAIDSRNDVISTSVVLLGIIISQIFSFYIDGYLGVAVGLFIILSGIKLIKETSDPLIGEKADSEVIKKLLEMIKSYPEILGIHDIQVHSYGPSNYFATMHVEVDASKSILETHDVIDNIERRCHKEFNVLTTLHMDPVIVNDPYTAEVKALVIPQVVELPYILSVHDFRIIKGPSHVNIVFDAVIKQGQKISDIEAEEQIKKIISNIDDKFIGVINIDHDYSNY